MPLRTTPVTLAEHIASIAMATGLTVGCALIVLVGSKAQLGSEHAPASTVEVRQIAERLVYVSNPLSAPAVVRSRQPAVSSPRSAREAASPISESEQMPAPDRDGVASDGTPKTAVRITPDTGSRWMRGALSPLFQPTIITSDSTGTRSSGAGTAAADGSPTMRSMIDDVAAGRRAPPPLSQAERDAQLRAEAREIIAARGAGLPERRTTLANGSFGIPLGFGGGPSREQRQRDSTIHAQTMVMLARVHQRADSARAARRQRRADSLAFLEDSLRNGSRP